MPETTNLGLAVSSNQNDSVLEYWNKMLNETDGNFVLLDNEFGILKTVISFEIPTSAWISEENGPFKASATVTLSNTLIRDNSVVEAYFNDIVNSAGVVLYSVTQSGTDVELVFYANEIKEEEISGFIKYVYGVEPPAPPAPTVDAVLENNSWDTIKSVCEAGEAANYWSLGDTKTDLGTDGETRTFRIVDMQGLYNKHVVFEQVECEDQYVQWNLDSNRDDNNAPNNYSISTVRTVTLPAIMAKYSNELQNSLTDTTYKAIKNGMVSTILEVTDKLFLEAAKELWETPSSTYTVEAENAALVTYQYYVVNTANSYRAKHSNGESPTYGFWLRSPKKNNQWTSLKVQGNGTIYESDVSSPSQQNPCAPCFSF